jgi:hypothetical protein
MGERIRRNERDSFLFSYLRRERLLGSAKQDKRVDWLLTDATIRIFLLMQGDTPTVLQHRACQRIKEETGPEPESARPFGDGTKLALIRLAAMLHNRFWFAVMHNR